MLELLEGSLSHLGKAAFLLVHALSGSHASGLPLAARKRSDTNSCLQKSLAAPWKNTLQVGCGRGGDRKEGSQAGFNSLQFLPCGLILLSDHEEQVWKNMA